jgi:hypothetical protein
VVAVYYGSVNVEYSIEAVPDEEYYEEAGITAEEVAQMDITSVLADLELRLTSLVVSNSIDFGAKVLEADIGGGNELIATALNPAGFGTANSSQSGFSASDALASFSLLMVPTVMVLSRESEIMDLLGELYNSMTDPQV